MGWRVDWFVSVWSPARLPSQKLTDKNRIPAEVQNDMAWRHQMVTEVQPLDLWESWKGLSRGDFWKIFTSRCMWLVGWLIGCLLGWLVGWLLGWLVAWLVGRVKWVVLTVPCSLSICHFLVGSVHQEMWFPFCLKSVPLPRTDNIRPPHGPKKHTKQVRKTFSSPTTWPAQDRPRASPSELKFVCRNPLSWNYGAEVMLWSRGSKPQSRPPEEWQQLQTSIKHPKLIKIGGL